MTNMEKMTNEEACAYAASWGSYMRSGDPGACMYGFSPDFRMQHEGHRAECIEWMKGCRQNVLDDPERYDADELENMDRFLEAVRNAEVA